MTMTAIEIDTVSRIQPGDEARSLARAVYSAFIHDLEHLDEGDWSASTVCEPWTVTDVVRHVLGAAKANASNREMLRQQLKGFRARTRFEGNALDAANALQVADHRHLSPAQLLDVLRSVAPRAVERRMKKPALLDRLLLPIDEGGSTPAGVPSKLNLGELFRVIYTRDVWLHRVDIAAAVGRTPEMDPAVDGRIVEDVIREWADRHGRPFDLILTGPLAARYTRPGDGPTLRVDAVKLCWILSGRGEPDLELPGGELLTTRLLF